MGQNLTRERMVGVRERLLLAGIAAVGANINREISLLDAVAQTTVPLTVAHKYFPDDEHFRAAMLDHLEMRLQHYVPSNPEGELPQQLEVLSAGYFTFAQFEPPNFRALHLLLPQQGKLHPSLSLFRNLSSAAGIEDWKTKSLVIMASIHGMSCLCTCGAARWLLPTAKSQLLRRLIRNLTHIIDAPAPAPIKPAHPQRLTHVPASSSYSKSTREGIKHALFRAGIENAAEQGLDALTLEAAANRIGVSPGTAYALIDGDSALSQELEDCLDSRVRVRIQSQIHSLPQTASCLNNIKAGYTAYLSYAKSDPQGFDVLTAISSGSVIPVPEESPVPESAFGELTSFARAVMSEVGQPHNSWHAFELNFDLWSIAQGMAHLISTGFLRELNLSAPVISKIADYVLFTMADRLELDTAAVLIEPEKTCV
ncbi:hypothetical protein WG936_10070 [Corynebacterium sp. H127]|uniref:TetR/AcrR family transcriptional regulator n=1 Tax=Corynebacterium sp. H127 TaxID=3133418 RepID=UPI0030B7E497